MPKKNLISAVDSIVNRYWEQEGQDFKKLYPEVTDDTSIEDAIKYCYSNNIDHPFLDLMILHSQLCEQEED